MTASVLKQDPNTKRFKRTLIYFNTDTQYANFARKSLYQATKRHLNNRQTVKNDDRSQKNTYLVLVELLQLVRCLDEFWHLCVNVKMNKCWFEPFCVWCLPLVFPRS